MTDELVAEQIEVHPLRIAAAFGASENFLVEAASLVDVPHLHGDVERCQRLIDIHEAPPAVY